MSHYKYLEQQLQRLELIKSEAILKIQQEHFESLAVLSKEKEKQQFKTKENYDNEILRIEKEYTTIETSLTKKEIKKKKKKEIKNAQNFYEAEELRIEEEFKTKKIEIDLAFSQIVENKEVEYRKKIMNNEKLYEYEIQKMETKFSLAHKSYMSKVQEITQNYKERSDRLHQAALNTNIFLGRQLEDLQSTDLYQASYRTLAEIIGLNGITEDVGTFISEESVYNDVQPMITYIELYRELKTQYKKEGSTELHDDFYKPKPLSSEIGNILTALELNKSNELSQQHIPECMSTWYKCFSVFLKTCPAFRNHTHNVMTKYNQRLAQMHGWHSMPLTKIHLCKSGDLYHSPYSQTPWYSVKEEYQKMQFMVNSEYYKGNQQLKNEKNLALLKAQQVLTSTLEHAENQMIKRLEQDVYVIDSRIIEIEKLHLTESKKHKTQGFFSEIKITPLHTIQEEIDEDESNTCISFNKGPEEVKINNDESKTCQIFNEYDEDDPEICAIFNR